MKWIFLEEKFQNYIDFYKAEIKKYKILVSKEIK